MFDLIDESVLDPVFIWLRLKDKQQTNADPPRLVPVSSSPDTIPNRLTTIGTLVAYCFIHPYAMVCAVIIAAFLGLALDVPASSCHAFVPQSPSSPLTCVSGMARTIRDVRVRRSMLHVHELFSFAEFIPASQQIMGISSILLSSDMAQPPPPPPPSPSVEPLSNTANVVVFLIGLIPFGWATVEFWRRIAVGATFGTGRDSVIIPKPQDVMLDDDGNPLITIGEDNNPGSSRGRQVLGKDALIVAYLLFAIAAASVGIAVYSVVTAPPMP